MSFFEKAKGFYESKKKPITIIGSSVLAVLFIASVVIAVFCGGEFTKKDEQTKEVKGLLQIVNASYAVSYIDGDSFSFDKESAEISLVARDPAFTDTVKIPKLPATEFGFLVNGEGEYISDPEQITMTKDVKTVKVVSKLYQTIGKDIEVSVSDKPELSEFSNAILMEAEAADLYTADGVLLTTQQKRTLPDANKPYISSEGATKAGLDCSGGAALRNFAAGMKVEFKFYSEVKQEVNFTILTCKRPDDTDFDNGYVITVNSKKVLTKATIPGLGGKKDYFTPYTMEAIKITLGRGLNTITFAYNQPYPCNLDAIKITTTDEGKTLALIKAEETPETPDQPDQPETPDTPDDSELKKELLLEAEAANLYSSAGKLLTDEEKRTLPKADKPYISSAGTTVAGTDCSGGAALRNFSAGMKVEFTFYSETEQEVDLTILTCKRPQATEFDTGYVITVNSVKITTGATVPGAGSGYFTPYTLPAVKIKLQKGLNVITFAYGTASPCNLDAIKITSATDKTLSVTAPSNAA